MDEKVKENSKILFEIKGIDRNYPGVQALKDVTFDINKNDVIGFAGENGAGKSTLLKLIAGVEPPDKGEMFLEGKKYAPQSFREANILGVSMVFQEQNLVQSLTVYENLFLSHEKRFQVAGTLKKRQMISEAKRYLESFGLDIDPRKEVSRYSFHERQMLEIIRAFVIADMYKIETPLILLDEPTAALPEKEREILLDRIKSFSNKATFIFVSHRLSELMNACNRILILKDGQLVGEVDPEVSEEREIHPLMVGRELSADTYRVEDQKEFNGDEDPVLRVRNLSKKGLYDSVSLEVRRGEILGIGGLIGSGKKFLGETLFGVGEPTEGEIIIDGHSVPKTTIRNMTKLRVGYVPSERKENGIIGLSTVANNLTITRFSEFSSRLGFINNRQESKLIKEGIEKFRIKATSEDLCFSLSGGNQQKIVLTKWIMKNLDILILDNPTRGIDVGAKEEIYTFIREAANKNLAIILITDDLLELIGLSNRIVIMKDGNISLIVDADKRHKPTEQELIRDMV